MAVQFRRSYRLRIAPLVCALTVVVALVLIALGANPRGIVALCIIFLFYWAVMSFVNWSRRIVIDDESIQMFGYFGGPIVIGKNDVRLCRYRRFQGNMRGSPDVFYFEIRDAAFHEIDVWRYGWGKHRHALFDRLGHWLDESSCVVSSDVQARLQKAAT